LSDVFRFGVKLEDSGINELDDEDYNKSMDDSSDSSDSEDENGGNGARRKGYSLTCGIFSLFSRQVDPASKRLSQGKKDSYVSSRDSQQSFNDSAFDSFAGRVGSVMVQLVFPDESTKFTHMHSWKRAAIISSLLVGQNKSLLRRLPAKQCTSLASSIGTIGCGSEPVVDRIATLLTRAIVACRDEINAMEAETVLDLVLILLSRHHISPDLDPTVSGLLIMGIAAAHVCNKVGDILDTEDLSISFTRSYLIAKQKALNMGSC
jgi:hypothetical protein